jgi:hypothetical protein
MRAGGIYRVCRSVPTEDGGKGGTKEQLADCHVWPTDRVLGANGPSSLGFLLVASITKCTREDLTRAAEK